MIINSPIIFNYLIGYMAKKNIHIFYFFNILYRGKYPNMNTLTINGLNIL